MSWLWGGVLPQPDLREQCVRAVETEFVRRYPERTVSRVNHVWFAAGAMLGPHDLPQLESCVSGGGVQLVGRCRFDNRNSLRSFLSDIWQDWTSEPSDVQLALAAYLRWGDECVGHLRGDWVIAVWEERRRQLLLARDATGNSGLFWWQGPQGLLFSNGLPALMTSPVIVRRPNIRWLAGILTVFIDPAEPYATGFEDVYSLPPGHQLIFKDNSCNVSRWWWPERLAPQPIASRAEYEEEFLRLYDDAVRQRLPASGGRVAATLSGGLDSGSVVALAAPALAARGEVLSAYVHVPKYTQAGLGTSRRTTNEWAHASETAAFVGNVQAVACDSTDVSPLAAMSDMLDVMGVPSHASGNHYWFLDILRQAKQDGAATVLTGAGGNATVSYAGTGDLWADVRARRWRLVSDELRSEQGGLMAGAKARLLKPALRPTLQWLRGVAAGRYGAEPWAEHAFMRPGLGHYLGLQDRMTAVGHDATFRRMTTRRLMQWRYGLRRGADGAGITYMQNGEHIGVAIYDPTQAQALVEFCSRLPDWVFWANGKQRGLIRSAMHCHLPPQVLFNQRKGLQSSDLGQRLAERWQDIDQILQLGLQHRGVQQVLDVPALIKVATGLRAEGAALPATGWGPFLRAVHVLLFLARY